MTIEQKASAGTLESSDVLINLEPCDSGINIELKSTVEKQFGKQIKEVVKNTLESFSVSSASIYINDQGALDCTIKSRLTTALYRACPSQSPNWEALN